MAISTIWSHLTAIYYNRIFVMTIMWPFAVSWVWILSAATPSSTVSIFMALILPQVRKRAKGSKESNPGLWWRAVNSLALFNEPSWLKPCVKITGISSVCSTWAASHILWSHTNIQPCISLEILLTYTNDVFAPTQALPSSGGKSCLSETIGCGPFESKPK